MEGTVGYVARATVHRGERGYADLQRRAHVLELLHELPERDLAQLVGVRLVGVKLIVLRAHRVRDLRERAHALLFVEKVKDGALELLDVSRLDGIDDGASRARAERLARRLQARSAADLVALHRRRANGDDALDAKGEICEAQLEHHGPGHAGRLRVVAVLIRLLRRRGLGHVAGHFVRADWRAEEIGTRARERECCVNVS